ncbi:MAG: hypothetical protein R3A78_06715 [Polyangiales bacterium]
MAATTTSSGGSDSGSNNDASTKDGGEVDSGDDASVEPVVNACTNTSDATAIGPYGSEVEDYGDSADKSVSGVATDCAVAAALGMGLTGDAARAYVQTCLLDKTNDAVSADCASCFAATAECAIAKCFEPCAQAPVGASEECIACRCENNCYQDYGTCSGREYGDVCDQ